MNRLCEEAFARGGDGRFSRAIRSRRPLLQHVAQDIEADLEIAPHSRPDLLEEGQVFRLRLGEA